MKFTEPSHKYLSMFNQFRLQINYFVGEVNFDYVLPNHYNWNNLFGNLILGDTQYKYFDVEYFNQTTFE